MKNSGKNNTETKQCDMCGQPFTGPSFPVYDENYTGKQRVEECEKCFKDGLEDQVNLKERMETVSTIIESVLSKEFELKFCDKCYQMTNHLNGICQKHK